MERVLAEAPARRGERQQHLSDLGIALRARFERWGDEADIDRAVSCHEQAVRSVRSADRRWPMHAENLANALWSRYLRFGSLADLERAAELHKQAAARFSERSAERPSCLSNLSLVLHAMYEHTGDLGYLEEAVTASRDSVAAGSGQADQYPICLNTLMIVLQTHYEHTANADDLDLVIEIGHELVAMTQLGAARAMYLHNLAMLLSTGTTFLTTQPTWTRRSPRMRRPWQRPLAIPPSSPPTLTTGRQPCSTGTVSRTIPTTSRRLSMPGRLSRACSPLDRSYGWFGCRDRRWPALSCRAWLRFLTTCAG